MKFVKWISLFFINALLFFGIGFYYGLKTQNFFYPGDNVIENYDSPHIIESKSILPDEPVSAKEEVITAETKYIVKTVVLPDTEMSNETIEVPAKYVGMDRETFLMAIENLENSPPAHEVEKGFVSAFVDSFSPSAIRITMYYETPQEQCFYIAVFDNRVVVYEKDRQTVYMQTGIFASDLPEEIQIRLINGITVNNEEELYDFLESYSS